MATSIEKMARDMAWKTENLPSFLEIEEKIGLANELGFAQLIALWDIETMPFIVKGIFSDPDYTTEQKSKLIAILRTGKNPTTEEFNGAYETMKKLNNKYRRNLDFRRYDQIKKSMK